MMSPELTLTTVNIGAPDAASLADFYARLLGWTVVVAEPHWVLLRNPSGGVGLSFQTEEHYVRPVWPSEKDEQGVMMHLEVRVRDLTAAVDHAVACGAVVAEFQPQDDVRVCVDPAGHPFCLWLDGQV
ncbi:VOC domain-containing protein [Stackebrandtia soli]